VPNDNPHRRPLVRLALFLVSAVVIFLVLNTLFAFTRTLSQLDAIEAERDQWQRQLDVVQALDLHPGDTVVDLGSGAGYFALKLAPAVGKRGRVLAVDLRRLSLFFLWTRALLRGQHNIHTIVGEQDNPRLPTGTADAVLICNTFHEFSNPEPMLRHIFLSLRPGGRIVVVDRAHSAVAEGHIHEVPLTAVAGELRGKGFEIVSEDGHFIDQPGNALWWLLVARKPQLFPRATTFAHTNCGAKSGRMKIR